MCYISVAVGLGRFFKGAVLFSFMFPKRLEESLPEIVAF